MTIGQTLGKAIVGLVIFAGPFSIALSQSALAAESVRSLSLEERIERLESNQQSRNMTLVDLQYKISDIQEEVRTLLGTQEENNYRLNQLTERQREIYKDVDQRLTEAQQMLKSVSANPQSNYQTTDTAQVVDSQSSNYQVNRSQLQQPVETQTDGREEADAYKKIFPLVTGKKYVQAITAYQQFLSQYPNGKLAANAHYWLGQVHYVQGQLDDAMRQFKIVSEKFSDSSKTPDALLKMAIIFVQQDKTEPAKELFQQISREYPGTSPARLADRRLKDL